MFKIDDKIEFHYLKEIKTDIKDGQPLKDYVSTSEQYAGKVVNVRDITEQPVSETTINRDNIKGRRSKVLYTVDLGDDVVKSFYDGRMVGVAVRIEDSKPSIFERIVRTMLKVKHGK
jgi:hypothetical protein